MIKCNYLYELVFTYLNIDSLFILDGDNLDDLSNDMKLGDFSDELSGLENVSDIFPIFFIMKQYYTPEYSYSLNVMNEYEIL